MKSNVVGSSGLPAMFYVNAKCASPCHIHVFQCIGMVVAYSMICYLLVLKFVVLTSGVNIPNEHVELDPNKNYS